MPAAPLRSASRRELGADGCVEPDARKDRNATSDGLNSRSRDVGAFVRRQRVHFASAAGRRERTDSGRRQPRRVRAHRIEIDGVHPTRMA